MTTFTDKIITTSTGTSTTKTLLNAGNNYTTSNLAGALKEVRAVQAATAAYTAAESSLQKFSIESTSIGSIMPKRWVITPTHGGLGTFAGVQVPIVKSTPINTNLFYSNTPLSFYGQPYIANTAAFRVGATMVFTTEHAMDREAFYDCVDSTTSSGTAAATVALNNIVINGGSALKMIYAGQGVGTVTASESYVGYLTVSSSDLTPIQQISAYLQPIGVGLGTAAQVLQEDQQYTAIDVQLRPTATLTASYTQDEALTSASNVYWGVGFQR